MSIPTDIVSVRRFPFRHQLLRTPESIAAGRQNSSGYPSPRQALVSETGRLAEPATSGKNRSDRASQIRANY